MSDWHREDIKAALRKRGTSLAAIARKHGVSRQAVTLVLHRPSAKWEAVIAKSLGVTAREIWPSRAGVRRHRAGASR